MRSGRARSLSLAECRVRLCAKRVGRVVFTDRALPSALPVNYLVTDDGIVFRTDPDGLLARLVGSPDGAVLGFEVDEVDESFEAGWSVLVVGLAVRVPESGVRALDGADLRAWGAENATTFVRIPFDRVSGRAVEASSAVTAADRASWVAGGRPVA